MATAAGNIPRIIRDRPLATPPSSAMRRMIEPTLIELGLTVIVVLWFLLGGGVAESSADMINTVGVVAMSLVIAGGGYRQLRQGVQAVWMPLLWYRAAMVVYYGVGSLAATWSNAATHEMMASFYDFFGREVIKLNLLMAVFHLVLLLTVRLLFAVFFRNRGEPGSGGRFIQPSNFNLISLGTLCLVIGTLVNWFAVLPQTLGWFQVPLYSTFFNLTSLAWIGYFMVTYWAVNHRRYAVVVAVIVIALSESVIGMLTTSKEVMLIPIVMVGMGFLYQRPTLRRLSVFALVLAVAFFILTPMVGYVRNAMIDEQQTPGTILASYGGYFSADTSNDPYADVQSGWSRLSFVNAGTFVMSQYDRGLPGNSYRYLPIVLIPRAIYPNKPIITDVARELSYEGNGNYYSSTTAGLPAEAYWNFGWGGAVVVAIFLGLAFGLWSAYSYSVIANGAWHLFFIVLLGARTALRINGAFVSDIIGPIGVVVLAHIVLTLFNRFLPSRVTHFIHDDAPAGA